MNLRVRGTLDTLFTGVTGLSVVLLALVLMAVLGPMVYRGSSAVFFRGTVEFRKMQRDLFQRADGEALEAEIARTEQFRRVVSDTIEEFRQGIDVQGMSSEVRKIHRELGQELRYQEVPTQRYTELRGLSRDIRDKLEEAFSSQDIEQIRALVAEVGRHRDHPGFKDTSARRYFELASTFLAAAEKIDLSRHHEYAASLHEIEELLFHSDERQGFWVRVPARRRRCWSCSATERRGGTRHRS